jgi:hypothetical protein
LNGELELNERIGFHGVSEADGAMISFDHAATVTSYNPLGNGFLQIQALYTVQNSVFRQSNGDDDGHARADWPSKNFVRADANRRVPANGDGDARERVCPIPQV